jgi:phosphoserine phosphatase
MNQVVVLIAAPADAALNSSIAEAARAALGATRVTWLAPGIAAEIETDRDISLARAAVADAPIDVCAVPIAHRRKKLLVADLESTLIENEFLDDIAAKAKLGPKIAEITRRAMAGELDFAGALRARVAMLKGLEASLLDEVYAGTRIMPGARTLIQTMRRHGATTAIVSGGFRTFVDRVQGLLGADYAAANRLLFEGTRLTGFAAEPIFDRQSKLATLKELSRARGIPIEETMAVGDGANDLEMVKAAGLGVAFRAKPVLAEAAHVAIRHGDLTALLYLQGYRKSEFAD